MPFFVGRMRDFKILISSNKNHYENNFFLNFSVMDMIKDNVCYVDILHTLSIQVFGSKSIVKVYYLSNVRKSICAGTVL